MAKYTVYWYGQNGKTGSETFFVRGAKLEQIYGAGVRIALDNTKIKVREFAVYNAKGVLVIDEKWDSQKKKWISVMPKKNKKENDYGVKGDWHPFGL